MRTAVHASSVEALEPAVVFGVPEDWLERSVCACGRAGSPVRSQGLRRIQSGRGRADPAGPGGVPRLGEYGCDQNFDAVLAGDLVHVLLVPESGVGERDLRLLARVGVGGTSRSVAGATIGARWEKSPVSSVISAASAMPLLVHRGLRVVALNVVAKSLHRSQVRVGQVDLSLWALG